jgi:prefoldin subunit 5
MAKEKKENGFWHPFDLAETLTTLSRNIAKILKNQEKIMSAISDFGDKMKVHNAKVEAAITGLQGDIKNLSDQIAVLQASSGTISAEDQATLDTIETQAGAIADKLDALDALTPPVVPVTP